ncbi:HNH endonuclease signature motif containing protein [Mesorhizobium sp. 1M-11]|uniref:HNH endonuclease signature motif containing protein n=1 Tax=Mesorhizobium sp. 1M-11 TaxID=1529006 RepID=UPI0009E90334|nr:HNH endonuclease signature motif containing protein [Mesorhizobium sp. 1M-11]
MSKWPYNTTAWRDLRQAKLSSQPLCEVCLRREVVEVANTVDHIVRINDGGEPFPPLAGLMSLCPACHQHKTNAERDGTGRKVKGCDVNGNPLDDSDGWYEPGGFAERESTRRGPAGQPKTELVSPDNQMESELWV